MKYFISENIKKVLLIFIISFFSIGITSEVVFASSFSSKITIDKKEIREGDEVEVTLSFNNFKDIKKGINSFKGKLDYDNNVFEKVTIDNMKALNNWESLLFNEKINEFITIHKNGVNQKEDVMKLRLKVKYGVLAGQTNIKVENIVASDGKKDITTEDLSIKLEVIEKQDGKPEEDVGNGSDQNNNQQPPDGNMTSNNQEAPSKNNTNKPISENLNTVGDKEEISKGENPSANDEEIKAEEEKVLDKDGMVVKKSIWTILRSILLIILTILLIILFIIWKKKKDGKVLIGDKKNLMLIFLIVSIAVLQLSSTAYAMASKGELNGDNKLDYLDITMLQQHLIKLKIIPEDLMEKADMNSDGMLTVTDLSFVVKKIENNLDYDVEISSIMDSYYVEKGDAINIKFHAEVSYGAKITEITLNGKEYPVRELGNNVYSVAIDAYDKSGIYDFNISSVNLDVGEKVNTSFNEKIEVLKDIPIIKDYEVKDIINKSKVQIRFNLEDTDDAMTSGHIKVITTDNKELINKKVVEGKNSFDLEVEEGKDYKAIIEVLYNRDSDKLEHDMDNSGELVFEKDIKLVVDYQLSLSNMETYDNENNKNTTFAKGQEIILGFESKNATTFVPENVVVNGISYLVESKDKQYIVKLRPFEKFGEKEIKIEEIQLSNGKKLEVKDNNTVKVTIKKSLPNISDVVMEENVEANKMDISFKVNDEDKSLKKVKMVLSDAEGNVILEEEISGNKYSKEVPLKNTLTSNYILKILGDYDLSLGNEPDVINGELYTEEKEAKARTIVKDSNVSKEHLEKGEDLKLTYTIKTNIQEKIKKIIVSDMELPVTEDGNDKYSATTKVGNKAGKQELTLTMIIFEEGTVANVNKSNTIEILKDKPYINDFKTEDDYNKSKMKFSFNIKDIDNSFISGKAQLFKKDGTMVSESKIKSSGEYETTFDVKEKEEYDFKVIAKYKRDEDGTQVIENKELLNKAVQMVIDYNLSVSNLETYDNKNNKNTILSKGEKITLGFESQNATIFVPENVVVNGKSYPVEAKDKQYIVKLRPFEEFGEKEIKIEEIQLSNGKELEVKDNNTVKVTIKKSLPNISDVVMEENVEYDKMDISFKINDEDKSLKKLKMVLSDANDNVILEEEISGNEYSKEVSLNNALTSNYTLKILGDYDVSLGNEPDVINKELYKEAKEAKLRVKVEDSTISKKHLEKGEELQLTYTIKTNKQDKIKKILVSNIEVPVTEDGNDKYSTAIKVGNKAGKQEVTLRRVIFEDGTVVKVNKSNAIEILKDKPYIDNFKAEDDYKNSQMKFSFDIEDIDNSFISAKAQLFKKDGTKVSESEITSAGHYETTFDVEEKVEYNFKVIAKYKRDEDGNQVIYNNELLNKDVQMIINYKLDVTNLETYSMDNTETPYVDRNSNIKLRFTSTNNTKFVPEKVIVNSNEYLVQNLGNNVYEVVLNRFNSAGVKEVKIEKIILNNTKELEVNKDNKVNVEVLKLKPTYDNFEYEELNNGKVRVRFNIVDTDQSIKKSKLVVNDGTNDIFTENNLSVGQNEIDFKPNLSENYTLKVISEYDLDTDTLDQTSNYFTDEIILEKQVTFNAELIQMKDISEVLLYAKNKSNKVELIKEVDVNNFNPQEYIAKVVMKDMSSFYSEVKGGNVVNGDFILELKYDNAVHYDGYIKSNTITVNFGKVENNIAKKVYFKDLINIIENNPNAEISLTQDLDAVDISSKDATIINTEFKGKINGNVYKIKNLNKPLFNSINGGTIENLIIDGATVNSSQGILSNTVNRGRIYNVHIRNSNITTGHSNGTGAFVGAVNESLEIEESSIYNSTVNGFKHIGGFIGWSKSKSNSVIKNSYISGTISTNSDAVGGMAGRVEGTITIENSYSDVILDAKNGTNNRAGVVGHAGGGSVILNNVISLADRPDGTDGYRVVGSGSINATNSFEISESKLRTNCKTNGIDEIHKKDINDEFFTKRLKWDSTIWNISNNNSDNMPVLNNEDIEEEVEVVEPENKDVYIPDIERLRKLDNYDTAKEIAYHNMYILMPFYDAKLYVDYGNKIDSKDILNTTKIKTVMPYDANGKMVVGLNSDNYDSISKIKVIFEDEQTKDYDLIFKRKLGDVATYKIDSLGIGYTYSKFILNTDISLVEELINEAKSMDYATIIGALTPEDESRLYVDYYNESVKPRLREVVINILQSDPDYNIYMDNEILKEKIKNDLILDKQLAKTLYAYNYYDKWYHFKVGEVPLSDIIFFNVNNMVNKNYNIKTISNSTVEQPKELRDTKKTIDFYNSIIKPQTNNLAIKEFLEYYIKIVAGYDNADDWFTNTFEGILSERGITGKEDKIDYRAWTLINKRNEHLLPILSAPQQEMYIISIPTQILFGSLNRYSIYAVDNNIEGMKQRIEDYTTKYLNFYNVSSTFINNSEELLNRKVHVQYDTILKFPEGGKYSGEQLKGITQDPTLKWVYEALDKFTGNRKAAAFATGTDVIWVLYALLDGNISLVTFTHETAHNQDGYYFYEDRGRRVPTGMEDHADGNIEQEFKDGVWVFNLINEFNLDDDISTNFKMERIMGKENIHSYYEAMFETYYVLDYLTAQAFFKLTPDQQSKVATQVKYVDANGQAIGDQNSGGDRTKYSAITADEFKQMNLQDMKDLWDNKIVLRGEAELRPNMGGYDDHYSIPWYQPHNDNGMPDSYTFKRLGFEMLGVGGYTDGYVAYRSNMTNNDLEALRFATKNSTITWKDYKLERYKHVEKNLKNISYFDTDKVIELYKEALIKDAAAGNRNETNNVRRILYGFIKRVTNDFTDATIYDAKNIKEINTAQELIEAMSKNPIGNYKIMKDLDFSGINVSNQDAYVMNKFYGMIDGNGFTFNGVTKPLMKSASYSHIKNFTIESPNYTSDAKAVVSIDVKNSMIGDIKVTNSKLSMPFVKNISGTLKQYGVMENTVQENEISSIDDLKAINADTTGFARKLKYKLTEDIDASSITSQNFIITGEFSGEINGNGFKILNQKKPLIENLTGTITNLKLENATIENTSTDKIGALAGSARNAKVEDITLNDITVNGRKYVSALIGFAENVNMANITANNINLRGSDFIGTLTGEINKGNIEDIELDNITISGTNSVASMIGIAKNANINKVTATNINVTGTNFYVAGLIGRTYTANVSNVVASGEISMTKTASGGIIGAMRDKSTLENAYGNVTVKRPSNGDNRAQNGGLVGQFESGKGTIRNSVSVADVNHDVYKVIAGTNSNDLDDIKKYLQNVYENTNATGLSNANTEGNITSIERDRLNDPDFYTDILKWSSNIWDFTGIVNGGLPTLKHK